jgi:hypothetical protein
MKNKKLKKKVIHLEKTAKPRIPRKPLYRDELPSVIEPTENDLYDELSRLDSFAYSRYNR